MRPWPLLDINQGLRPIEPSPEEAKLAEELMVVARNHARDPEGKLTAWSLPACIAVALARYVLNNTGDHDRPQNP